VTDRLPFDLPVQDVRSVSPSFPFTGSDYVPAFDQARLTGQLARVYTLMRDGQWRTLTEIAEATGDPHASISAQLRHLRKRQFGSFTVEKRRRGVETSGLFEYRVTAPAGTNAAREQVEQLTTGDC